MQIKGEVITTPYSFVATAHSLWWEGIKPVFTDVDPETGNLDPEKIEEAITPQTTAIMPVHVYGTPCDTEGIQAIADKHGLKVIYDAAHAFGVKANGKWILKAGDLSTLSFHATKTYNTIEGGAIICRDAEMKRHIDHLKNFGFEGETNVVTPGLNSRMDEVRAAYGLLNLQHVDAAMEARRLVTQRYREALRHVQGISFMDDMPGVRHNYSYFPIFVNEREYGMSRDQLYLRLKYRHILARRYFYPLISTFVPYCDLPSASPGLLPIAAQMANEVICLPLHHDLTEQQVSMIIQTVSTHGRLEGTGAPKE